MRLERTRSRPRSVPIRSWPPASPPLGAAAPYGRQANAAPGPPPGGGAGARRPVFGRREAGRTPTARSSKMRADGRRRHHDRRGRGPRAAGARPRRGRPAARVPRALRRDRRRRRVVAYLDGNSLGRPPRRRAERLERFVARGVGRPADPRLGRGLDGPAAARSATSSAGSCLGAAPGQVAVGDSTTVLLYKLMRAAVAARPGRTEIVLDTRQLPDRPLRARGHRRASAASTLRWIDADPAAGVTAEQVAAAVGPRHRARRAQPRRLPLGATSPTPRAITRIAHDAGALVLWDLCHSAGSVPVELDDWGVDLAVGCTYKYLNGGPGSPAFGYVARRAPGRRCTQPIQGWMGGATRSRWGPGYEPAAGHPPRSSAARRRSLGMLAMQDMLELIEEAGIGAIRAKSVALTEYAIEARRRRCSPRSASRSRRRATRVRRGGHVTVAPPRDARGHRARCGSAACIPDYRDPSGLRIGLSPLSTSFAEAHARARGPRRACWRRRRSEDRRGPRAHGADGGADAQRVRLVRADDRVDRRDRHATSSATASRSSASASTPTAATRQGGLMRERFIPRLLEADPGDLSTSAARTSTRSASGRS